MQLCCDKESRCVPFACGIMSCRYTCVLWILLSFAPVQTDSALPLFWFPQGRGLGRPWHLHTNENNHGKYVNLPGCGWLRQTMLFQKGHMLLWVITYGNWIHLTRTIKAQRLTRACDVLYAQCSTAQDDTCMLAFFWVAGLTSTFWIYSAVLWPCRAAGLLIHLANLKKKAFLFSPLRYTARDGLYCHLRWKTLM